jgi:hypothetical protein
MPFELREFSAIDPRDGSLKMNFTPTATMPIAVPTMPVNRVAGASGSGVISGLQRSL